MNSLHRGHSITAKDKYYRSLYKEYQKLLNIQRSAPLIEIDEPYQRGWVRFFRLRDDASRRIDAPALTEILKRVNVYQYCRNGTFMEKNPKTGISEPIGHHPKRYSKKDWSRLGWPESHQKYFETRLVTERNYKNQWVRNQRYVFKYPFYFVSCTEKHFVTHQRVNLPDVESRITEIMNYFDHHQVWHRLHHLFGERCRWRSCYDERARPNATYQAILEGLEELNTNDD